MDKMGVDEPVVADAAAVSETMLRILENCMVMMLDVESDRRTDEDV